MQLSHSPVKDVFRYTHQTYFYAIKKAWFSIIFLWVVSTILTALFQRSMLMFPHNDFIKMNNTLGLMCVSILPSAVFVFNIPYCLERKWNPKFKETLAEFTKRTFVPLLTASIYTLVYVTIGFLYLLIPGIKRMVEYLLVPIVVYFEPEHQGKLALERSKQLTQGFFWILFLVSLVEIGINESLKYFLPLFIKDPTLYVIPAILTPLRMAISIYTFSFVYYLYKVQHQRLRED